MNADRTNTPGVYGEEAQDQDSPPKPVPRDMPDQLAGAEGDPWELDDNPNNPDSGNPEGPEADTEAPSDRPDSQVPDTDEAGTGRRGDPQSGSRRPEHPVPDEPTA